MTIDPTTAAIQAQVEERDQRRAENQRLRGKIVAARPDAADPEVGRDRPSERGAVLFVAGYDQAVREIRDHFAKRGQPA